MALPSSGIISVDDIRTEFGLTGAVSFGDLYRGANGDGTIHNNYGNNSTIPTTGAIDLEDFHNVYYEGTIAQKHSDWLANVHSGYRVYADNTNGQTILSHTGHLHQGGAIAIYASSDTVYNTQNFSNLTSESQWTTVIAYSAAQGNTLAGSSMTIAQTHTVVSDVMDTDTTDDVNLMITHLNIPVNQVGNLQYDFARSAQRKTSMGSIVVMPGKWEIKTTIGHNPSGNTYQYETLNQGEVIVWGVEFGIDSRLYAHWENDVGETAYEWSNIQSNWYNGATLGMGWIGDTTTASVDIRAFNSSNNQYAGPDTSWVLEEVL